MVKGRDLGDGQRRIGIGQVGAPRTLATALDVDGATRVTRLVVGLGGGIYLLWWFAVELLLPGSFNPLSSRLIVVGLNAALFVASFRSRWVERRLSALLTAWLCVLAAHYCYLLVGNHGDASWWVGTLVTFAAASMCVQSTREAALFSVFSLACAIYAASVVGQLRQSIYVPGLATILLLASLTKRSQRIAHDATEDAARARKASKRSDEQRLQLAAIVESSSDAIIASNLDGLIESWNKGAERLYGYTAEEVVGRPIDVLAVPGLEAEDSALIARLSKGESVGTFETVRRRKDGTVVSVSKTISPIRDSAGALVGASMAARDISDKKRAEAESLRAREVAEAANRELEAFSYSVAHDLRAPLRGIVGFSQALLEDYAPKLDAVAQRYLHRVSASANEMGRLIDGLLELGRVSRMGMRRQPVDLSELARSTARRLKEVEPHRAVEFVIKSGLTEKGDGALLGAAIENLLGNAWKFTRSQPNARIEFGTDESGAETRYFVRDNGAGFDMAYASKLFGVFQRLHTQSEFEGTGVGLATVQRILQRHGGRIWAEGKVGAGACFYFTFGPAADPGETA
ncbi:MAG TPA: PAS domain S-box protein [Polyangiaceae bacterium]|nr:PAS domain S-box protein [Polyangiaceae bacterium]